MQITKIPDQFNIDYLISERIDVVYKKCPFCYKLAIDDGESEKEADNFAKKYVSTREEAELDGHFYRKYISKEEYIYSFESPSDFGCYSFKKPIEKGLFRKKYYFVHKKYRCGRCNAEWHSADYPLGLNEDILNKFNEGFRHKSNEESLCDLANLVENETYIPPTTMWC